MEFEQELEDERLTRAALAKAEQRAAYLEAQLATSEHSLRNSRGEVEVAVTQLSRARSRLREKVSGRVGVGVGVSAVA